MGIAVHPLERAMRPIQGSDSPVGAPLIVVPPPGGAQKKNVLVGRQGLFGHSDSKCRLLEDGGAVGAQVPVTG